MAKKVPPQFVPPFNFRTPNPCPNLSQDLYMVSDC